ncbi:MAG TPA: hypothetical protein DCR55_16980 [Lentisphaeria bacterium]|nr:hypothetical protein [Lentisphaeria bacterium]
MKAIIQGLSLTICRRSAICARVGVRGFDRIALGVHGAGQSFAGLFAALLDGLTIIHRSGGGVLRTPQRPLESGAGSKESLAFGTPDIYNGGIQ